MKQENGTMKSFNTNWPSHRTGYAAKKCLAIVLAVAAVAAASAAPALAAGDQDQDTVHVKRLHMYAPGALNQTKSTRDAAIQECSNEAAKLSSSGWQTAQFAAYGTCMTEHGQQP